MKRFLLFAGEDYYPWGGWRDFVGSFDTAEEAMAVINQPVHGETVEWGHIVDSEQWAAVYVFSCMGDEAGWRPVDADDWEFRDQPR